MFSRRWMIDPPLEIIVPAKRTLWPEAPLDLPFHQMADDEDHFEVRASKKSRSSRSNHSTPKKKKREHVDTLISDSQNRLKK